MLHLKKYLLSLFSGCKRVLSSVVVTLKFNRFALKMNLLVTSYCSYKVIIQSTILKIDDDQ